MSKNFEAAADRVRKFTKRPTDSEIMEVYSYYKQATVGNCNIDKPSDGEGSKKWEAWNSRRGMNKDEAKKLYINRAEELSLTYA